MINQLKNTIDKVGPVGLLITIVTSICNIITPEVEEWPFAREIFVVQKLFFEEVLFVVLCVIWIKREHVLSFLLGCQQTLIEICVPLERRKILFVFGAVVVLCAGYPLGKATKDYSRARYAYIFKGGLQTEFRQLQLLRAADLESEYQFSKARKIYSALLEAFPTSASNASIKQRIRFLDGLQEYAERLVGLYEEAVAEGDQRRAFRLLIERSRVSPLDEEAEILLEKKIKEIEEGIIAVNRIDLACRRRELIELSLDPIAMSYAFEPATLTKMKNRKVKSPCEFLLRFPAGVAASSLIGEAWQMGLAKEIQLYAQRIRGGEKMQDLFPQSPHLF